MKLATLFRDMSIRRKLTLITLLSAGAALFLAALVATWHQWSIAHAELEKITHSQALIVASNSTSALLRNDPKSAGKNLEALSAFDNIEFAALYDRQGKRFAMFVAAGQTPPPPFSCLRENPCTRTHFLPQTRMHTRTQMHMHTSTRKNTYTRTRSTIMRLTPLM